MKRKHTAAPHLHMQSEEIQETLANTEHHQAGCRVEVLLSLSRKYDQRRLLWIPERGCTPPQPSKDLPYYYTCPPTLSRTLIP